MTETVGVLLAAGAGRRMGGPKALVAGDDGVPWVVAASRVLAAGGCSRVAVVVGAEADRVSGLLVDEPVAVVEAVDWASGMGASLVVGLAMASLAHADAALVHLVDLPDVGADVVHRLLLHASSDALARATYASGPGHPVLLGRAHWDGVTDVAAGDRGARDYLDRHDTALVDCSDLASGLDRDTPEVR